MRKLIVANFVSLDGYFEGPGNNVTALPFDAAFSDYNAERMRAADTLLLGRTTFDNFKAYWPAVVDSPDARDVDREIARFQNSAGSSGGDEVAVCVGCGRVLPAFEMGEYTKRRAMLLVEVGLCVCPPGIGGPPPAAQLASSASQNVERDQRGASAATAGQVGSSRVRPPVCETDWLLLERVRPLGGTRRKDSVTVVSAADAVD